MNAAAVFDTLAYMDELKKAGIKVEEAEAITKATQKALNQVMENRDLATRSDISSTLNAIHTSKNELTKYINETMWKTIGLLATFQTIMIGSFGMIQYFVGHSS